MRQALAAVIAASVVIVTLAPGAAAIGIGQDPGSVCVGGWAIAGSPSVIPGSTAVDVTVQNGTQWVAGSANEEGPTFLAYTARSSTQGWGNAAVAATAPRSLLTGITINGPNGLWTAGERTSAGGQTQPLIEHFNGVTWSQSRIPSLRYGGALSDITQVGPQLAIAVGFGADLKGQHALAYGWRRSHWSVMSPKVSGFSALTGVSAARDATTWAVGWIQTASGYRPLLERWTEGRWARSSLPGSGSIVLTGVDVLSKRSAWATGFRETGGSLSGVVAHWDGHVWALVSGLQISATGGSILRGIAIVNGSVTAVGESWDETGGYKDSQPVVVQRIGTSWSTEVGVAGIQGGELLAIAGGSSPVAVGRTTGRAVAIVPCTPGHSPSTSNSPPSGFQTGTSAGGALATAEATHVAMPARSQRGHPTSGTVHRALPRPRSVPGLQIVDVTAKAGLTMSTLAFNGVSADLNGDGWPDLVIGRRARPLWVLVNEANGTFMPVDNFYRQADRHGCAVGNLDATPAPEIVCAIGASHGLGIKDNEVWLDPLGQSASNAADALGLADPLGRGRETALLDYNHDGMTDIYFGSDPSRPDGLPGSNHLYRNVDDGASFEPAPEANLDLGVGSECLIPVDLDGNGWTDLIDCEYIPMAGYAALHIFHNNHGVFSDVTGKLGMDGRGIFDAAVGDLNHDGHKDLVTLSSGQLEVWLQSGGTLHKRVVMCMPNDVAVTLADVNGNGRPDIYVVRGTRGHLPVQDVLLLNNGTGTRFTSIRLPSVQPGPGGDAVAIDYDRNGKQDLLVMHGNNVAAGPIQLLAFGPPWPFGSRSATPSALAPPMPTTPSASILP